MEFPGSSATGISLLSAVRMRNLRLYYEIALRAFRRASIYRAAYIAGILTNAFFAALRCFVYLAVYRAGTIVAGFSANDAITYTWVTQALISIGAGWLPWDLMQTIRSGDVITDLSRPWSFYGYWLSRSLGERCFNLLLRGSVTYLLGFFFFAARIPRLTEALAFVVAIGLALLVSFAYGFIVNLTAFWLIDNTGVMIIANILLTFFSGFLLPLAFFPPWLRQIAQLLPFQAITSLPAEIWLGHLTGPAVWRAFALQAGWTLALTLLAMLMLQSAVRKVVIQGG